MRPAMTGYVVDAIAGLLILRHLWHVWAGAWLHRSLSSELEEEREEAYKAVFGDRPTAFQRRMLYDAVVRQGHRPSDEAHVWLPAVIGAFVLIARYAHLFR